MKKTYAFGAKYIVSHPGVEPVAQCLPEQYDTDEWREFAAMSVKAINSHDKLVEALRAVELARHIDTKEDWVYATTLTENALKGLE